ncbi:MAG: hypothetical protein JSS64_02075 [Bacteroidetes bacterium]|nr:hypothetical protein [Bacteroidota bacterium]
MKRPTEIESRPHNKKLPRPVPTLREAGLNGFYWTFPAKAGQVVLKIPTFGNPCSLAEIV